MYWLKYCRKFDIRKKVEIWNAPLVKYISFNCSRKEKLNNSLFSIISVSKRHNKKPIPLKNLAAIRHICIQIFSQSVWDLRPAVFPENWKSWHSTGKYCHPLNPPKIYCVICYIIVSINKINNSITICSAREITISLYL